MNSDQTIQGEWWIKVLKILLLIGGIEKNPGPKRKRTSITNKKEKRKRHVKYNLQLQSLNEIISQEEGNQKEDNLLPIVTETETNIYKKYSDTEIPCKKSSSVNSGKVTCKQRRKHLTPKIDKIKRQIKYENMKSKMTTEELDQLHLKSTQHVRKWRKLHTEEWKAYVQRTKTMLRKQPSFISFQRIENRKNCERLKKLRLINSYRKLENARQCSRKQLLRLDHTFKLKENAKQQLRKQSLRFNPDFQMKENNDQKLLKRTLRSKDDFKVKENKQQRLLKRTLRCNPQFKVEENKQQQQLKRTLRSNPQFKVEENKQQQQLKRTLRSNPQFKVEENKQQQQLKRTLRSNPQFKVEENRQQQQLKRTLRSNPQFKVVENKQQQELKRTLRSNPQYKEEENMKQNLLKKSLRSEETYKNKENEKQKATRKKHSLKKQELEKDIEYISQKFQETIQCGPVYVCTCCKRMLYRHSVVHVPADKYKKNNVDISLVNICLSKYKSVDNFEWICKTCHNAIKHRKMPAQCEANELSLEEKPFELSDLCSLEERLISLRIPFMQIINLPRGGQKGIKGPAVNVPSCLDTVIDLLPRLPSQLHIVPLKLKRKLAYRGHVLYQSIRPNTVMTALAYLKKKHLKYKDIDINQLWIDNCYQEDYELASCLIEGYDDNDYDSDDNANEKEDVLQNEESDDDENDSLKGIPYNTCLQPSSQIYTGKEIISVAPGEGRNPISFFTDTDCETLAFPTLFPSGQFGFQCNRQVHLTLKKYFNQRILNSDPRFAQNIEYLFFAQYITEAKQILDNINIAMRKGSKVGNSLTAGNFLQNIECSLSQNEGFRFLQNVRGSFPYWVKTLNDLNAMVRQLDIPTWFCSFSCADLKWPETIKIIAQQQGQNLTNEDVSNLDWQQKSIWLKSNPVTAARHFEFKVMKFLHNVLMSNAEPIGKITDYFIRTEFQQRGSPHVHCLFWIQNAPKIGVESDDNVCNFIDKYVSACLPDQESDEQLHELVTKLQRHTHSSSCKKTSKLCRFNFPKPPTNHTLIASPLSIADADQVSFNKRKQENAHILKIVHDELIDNSDQSLNDILIKNHIEETRYTGALKESTNNPTIIYHRSPKDILINNYNPALMKIWKANHDIQYVTNAYACAMYILSYVSKGERQMGELLKKAAKECAQNESIRNQMKILGNVFLTHRELSAQEAAYRLLSIPLKHCSRSVVFVNSGLPEERTHIVKPIKQLNDLEKDSEDIFEKNIIDRYQARPNILEKMCLAEFATNYRLKGGDVTETSNVDADDEIDVEQDKDNYIKGKEIKLKQNMGTMVKRRTESILRSPRFSSVKSLERYSHSQLMLFYPWRNEIQDLKGNFNTYSDYLQTVLKSVTSNKAHFEKNSEDLDLAIQNSETYPQHEWDKLASTTEQEKSDDIENKSMDEIENEFLNDLHELPEMTSSSSSKQFTVEFRPKLMSDDSYSQAVRSLNPKQRQLFDITLKWCRDLVNNRKNGRKQSPFYTFLTGGAGTGKSHIIRTIVNMVQRELRPICESPDNPSVLLTAPTGIAATNIDGTTIHSAFSIPINMNNNNYNSLSHEKLASFRNAFTDLSLVVIDEISMVGLPLLTSIHKRLQEIRGITDNTVLFGGISILAVGDFYQIEPVKQKPLFALPSDPYLCLNPNHLWKDVFSLFELTEVMRQIDDDTFASILNRVRIGKITSLDLATLKSREIQDDDKDYPHDALHVFSINRLVDEHNLTMLNRLHGNSVTLEAIDSKTDLHTNKANVTSFPDDPSLTGGLLKTLTLIEGARVMITKNIDISDGLVNGLQGTVKGFMYRDKQQNSIVAVLVKFDNQSVGLLQRQKHNCPVSGAVPIFHLESKFYLHKKGAIEVCRKQFPLKLAFASTIHKVQGLSLQQIVVSFEGNFRPGQAYVALSRAKTLNGLYLKHFDPSKIRCSQSVEDEMKRLQQTKIIFTMQHLSLMSSEKWIKICHINVRSLLKHIQDLISSHQIITSDVILVSETWLKQSISNRTINIPGFSFYRRDRYESYKNHTCKENCQMCNNKGGVGIYVKEGIQVHILPQFFKNEMEYLFIEFTKNRHKITTGVVYRQEHISVKKLTTAIVQELQQTLRSATTIIAGDFNVHYSEEGSTYLTKTMKKQNFSQLIKQPTHIAGSILDHIYINNTPDLLQSGILPCYFSDHNFIYCVLPTPGDSAEIMPTTTKSIDIVTAKYASENKKTKPRLTRNSNQIAFTPRLKDKCNNLHQKEKTDIDKNNNDVVIIHEDQDNIFIDNIKLPSEHDSQQLANHLKLKMKHDPIIRQELYDIRYKGYLRKLQQHTCPCIIDAAESDGNCYFRVIAKQILGTEKYHHHIRKILCDFELAHMNTFAEWMDSGTSGLKEHVSNMRRSRQWATEIELLATATYFNTVIYEFTEQYPSGMNNWKWIHIKPLTIHKDDPVNNGIPIRGNFYIHHTLGVHYDGIFPA